MGTRERLTDFLTVDQKDGRSWYLKSAVDGQTSQGFRIRRPDKEMEAYKLLSPYFNMPRARLAQTKTGPVLVVRGINQPSADKIVKTDPAQVRTTFNCFIRDMSTMWQQTKKPMDESVLGRDWRGESLATLYKLMNHPQIEELATKKVVVNGRSYPSLGTTIEQVWQKLQRPEKTMVLSHGDEHIANLIPNGDGYFLIDPGNWTGYNSPSAAVNNMVAGNYLFTYPYQGEIRVNGAFEVDYRIGDDYVEPELMMREVFQDIDKIARDLNGGDSLDKEFLFVNMVRCGVGWVNRSGLTEADMSLGMVFTGMAVEKYYGEEII